MRTKRLQNRIAESKLALPITVVYAFLVYLACGLFTSHSWFQVACLVVSAFLMVGLNNLNALIRIYSRMVSCSFLVLSVMACFVLESVSGAVVQICFIAYYMAVFHAYQDKLATAWSFYSFLCIGIASTMFIQILFLVPILWILHGTNILALSGRTFWASVIGLISPYWFIGGYYAYTQQLDTLVNHIMGITRFQPLFDYSTITMQQMLTFGFILLVALIGIVHFLRSSYNDKIRTRMIYETFITVDICCIIFLILQPQHYDQLIRIIIINTAPLIAHYIALTRTAITNITFLVLTAGMLALTAYNLWMH